MRFFVCVLATARVTSSTRFCNTSTHKPVSSTPPTHTEPAAPQTPRAAASTEEGSERSRVGVSSIDVRLPTPCDNDTRKQSENRKNLYYHGNRRATNQTSINTQQQTHAENLARFISLRSVVVAVAGGVGTQEALEQLRVASVRAPSARWRIVGLRLTGIS